jgi:hypothetical protein
MQAMPLSRNEVRSVIAGEGAASRIPCLLHFWTRPERFGPRAAEVQAILDRHPQDAQVLLLRMPGLGQGPAEDPSYRWTPFEAPAESGPVGIDSRVAITDWNQLDEVLSGFPDARSPALVPALDAADGRYRLAGWLSCLFERHWSLRGMSDALVDFTTDPACVHRLYRALTDFYLLVIERARLELGADGILTSDDLGTQEALFFRPEMFDEFFAPYYRELIVRTHELGMQFWLHSCGNIGPLLPALLDLGLDVIHPVQRFAVDERLAAARCAGRICVWAGIDVQRILPFGTPEEVRAEVRRVVRHWQRPEGRLMLTAGNMLHEDCPSGNIAALFDECCSPDLGDVPHHAPATPPGRS